MVNAFTFVITGVDKGTAVVRKFNQNVARAMAPVNDVRASLKALSKEAGVGPVGTAFSKMSTFAGDAFSAVSKLAGPLGVVSGVATVTGVVALAAAWAKWGYGVAQTAESVGLSTGQLQAWRLSAQQMGIDAATTDGSIEALGNTIEDALYGRNQNALMMMNKLGISLKRTKDGAIDTGAEMLQLADVLARFKGQPQRQEKIAQIFGVEGQINQLRLGRAAVQKMLDDAAKSGAVQDKAALGRATATFTAIQRFKQSLMTGGNNVVSSPLTKGVFDYLTWYNEHGNDPKTFYAPLFKPLAAMATSAWTRVRTIAAGGMKAIGDEIRADTADIVNAYKTMWDLIVGVFTAGASKAHQAGQSVFDFMGGENGLPARFSRRVVDASGGGAPAQGWKTAYDFFVKQGWSPAQAAGIAQNLDDESGVSRNPKGSNDGGTAFGVAQWHANRQAAFAKWAGHDIRGSSLDEQFRFVQQELTAGAYKAVGDRLKNANSAFAAGAVISKYYEGPAGGDLEAARRGRAAAVALAGGGNSPAGEPAPQSTAPQPGMDMGGGAPVTAAQMKGFAGGKVEVNVSVQHDGKGAVVKTSSSGDVVASARIERSLTGIAA